MHASAAVDSVSARDAASSPDPLAKHPPRFTAGLADGLGDRVLTFDDSTSASLELLRFRRELGDHPGFEAALRERVDLLSRLHHPSIATARSVERRGAGDGLTLVSKHTAGRRLSDILSDARGAAFAQELIGQLAPALASLHQAAPGVAHGVLTPERIVVTREGRLVIVEHVIGSALATLQWPASRLRSDLGLAVSGLPDTTAALDARADVVQLGVLALSLLLGRRLDAPAYPPAAGGWLAEFASTDAAAFARLRSWLERALQIGDHAFASATEARDAFLVLAPPSASTSAAPSTHPAPPSTSTPLASDEADGTPEDETPFEVDTTPVDRGWDQPPPDNDAEEAFVAEPVPVAAKAVTPPPVAATAPAATVPAMRVAAAPLPAAAALEALAPATKPMLVPVAVATAPMPVNSPRPSVTPAPVAAASATAPKTASGPSAPSVSTSSDSPVSAPQRSSRNWAAVVFGVVALGEALVIAGLVYTRPAPITEALIVRPPAPIEAPAVAAGLPASAPITPTPTPALAVAPPHAEPARTTEPPAAPRGTFGGVRVSSPIELQVFENGALLGSSSGPIAVSEGSHALELVNETLGFRFRQTIDVKAGQMAALQVAVPNGRISINAVPWASVTIDGTPAGDTPLANLALPIGTHEIVFRHPQFGEQRQTVVVKAEGLTRVSASLQR